LIERIIEYVKDRTKLFDNYIPCIKDECDEKHAEMLLNNNDNAKRNMDK
jgi:hypothetical protein